MQWERLIFPWSLIQKNGPNDWENGYFSDAQIASEIAAGRQVVGLAVYTPQWATSTPNNAKVTNVPANLYLAFDDPKNYWGQFMYKLALRYKGQINTWVVWNEPDLYANGIQYTWNGSDNDFYQLQKVAYQAIKKANPDAQVALPGMRYWPDKLNGRPLYLASYLQVAGQDPTARSNNWYFDIATIHTYGDPLNVYAQTEVTRQALALFGLDKPIWVGEANTVPYDDTGTTTPHDYNATMEQQAAYVVEAFALARAAGVRRMSIYKMTDEKPEGQDEHWGLVRDDGTTRPAFQAYQTAVKYMGNPTSAVYTWDGATDPPTAAQIAGLLQSDATLPLWPWPGAVNRVTMEEGPQRITVLWNSSSQPVTAKFPAVASYAGVVNDMGQNTGQVVAQNGEYSLPLLPASDNTDPLDRNVSLVGGAPEIIVEQVTPLPTAVDAPVEAVWPLNGAAVSDAQQANVSTTLYLPGTTQPAPCRWSPNVQLMASINGGASTVLATGMKRLANQNGLTYPVWDFNGVDVSPAQRGGTVNLWISVDGVPTQSAPWVYAADVTQPDFWQQLPTSSCT